MDVIINLFESPKLKKQLLTLKPTRKDGLILQMHHTIRLSKEKKQRVRFISICFNKTGQILAIATLSGDIYVIDFGQSKYWSVTNIVSCSILKFSSENDSCLIAGKTNGLLQIINIYTGEIIANLEGHSYPIINISFSSDFLCVTSSSTEAMVWDLRSNSKVQILSISSNAFLKQMLFVPVSNDILACFNDDSIHIWKYGSFQYLNQITPASWNKFYIKCIAFTKNGRIMAVGGHSPNIAIFSSDTWSLEKVISLPEQTKCVKCLRFISQAFDGGANRILSVLSSNGAVYFYDMQGDVLLSKLSLELEILRYEPSTDGKYFACIIRCGRVNIYLLPSYITITGGCSCTEDVKSDIKKRISVKKSALFINNIKGKIDEVLDSEKLRNILKEFGQYPELYRAKIWVRLLRLPNNKKLYNTLINLKPKVPIADFNEKFPLESKASLKNLKKVISNMVNWSPFFKEVDYLPVFAFPFVKVFKNNPVACFEAVCTIVVNWCQYWFEYFPLPPVNILAMVENVLLEHNPRLLNHFTNHNITSKTYAWTILQTVFSEVLTGKDWLVLWDHVVSNEPSFFILAAVAFNLVNAQVVTKMYYVQDIERFYHQQNLLDIKKLISKTYYLLHNTSDKNHPRQYLNYFTPIEIDAYPQFTGYPPAMKVLVKNVRVVSEKLDGNSKQRHKATKLEEVRRNVEENVRMNELDNIYKSKLEDEIAMVDHQRQRLDELKKTVQSQDYNLQKVIQKNCNHKLGVCFCTSSEAKSARLCEKAVIVSDLKATNKLIRKIEEELEKQKSDSLRDIDVRELAAETVELEMKILKELQLLNSLKEVPNMFEGNDDFAILKYTMKKIEDGYQARNSSPIS